MTFENWASVPGFPGYRVSDKGRVLGKHGRILSPGGRRYLHVVLRSPEREGVTIDIHVLVAAAFLGPRPEGYHVDHMDGDRRNNAADNLRYLTPRENVAVYRGGLRSEDVLI